MKHIKKFNESFEMDPRTMDIEDNAPEFKKNEMPFSNEKRLSIQQLKDSLSVFLSDDDVESCTKNLKALKDKFPYIREEEPFKTIWWDAVKKWHEKVKTLK
jgi:hypothetical protein